MEDSCEGKGTRSSPRRGKPRVVNEFRNRALIEKEIIAVGLGEGRAGKSSPGPGAIGWRASSNSPSFSRSEEASERAVCVRGEKE